MSAYDSVDNMTEDNRYVNEATETSPLLANTQRSLAIDSEPISSSLRENSELTDIADESPYEEVAANVSNQDNRTLPCLTFRSCILGLLFTCILAFVNQFFTFRTIPIFLSMIVAQLLSYPMGRAMASTLPRRKFMLFGGRWRFSLNPGPFSVKEHCIISIMANTASVRIKILYLSDFQLAIVGYCNGDPGHNYSAHFLQAFN
jgi:hypothetical protein